MKACDMWGTVIKQQVIDSGAIVVIRPDSGDPATVVLNVVHRLEKYFGSVTNAKGFKVLNNVRVIQGDGINEVSIRGILMNLEFAGYSADNVAFGMGGALLQILNRDTQRFAMKASAAQIDGKWIDVFKDPVTDTGKRSKRGRITLIERKGNFQTVLEKSVKEFAEMGWTEVLQTVWENGKILKEWTFGEIRAESNKPYVREQL
jgi:nicotinamide phosphoribosyltransferase